MTPKQSSIDDILKELTSSGLTPVFLQKSGEKRLYSLTSIDSRLVKDHGIFCAIKGQHHDGHHFIPPLSEKPILILCETDLSVAVNPRADIVKVTSTRKAWAQLESFFYDHPGHSLTLIGITGTNGKTSTAWMIYEFLNQLNIPTGFVGTIGLFSGKAKEENPHTTPDPPVLYPFLRKLLDQGITHVAMEVSSHSLAQGKLHPLRFSVSAFTNFTQDHLDFHGTMEGYFKAKLSLFSDYTKPNGCVLIHESIQEKATHFWKDLSKSLQIKTYGTKSTSHIQLISKTQNQLNQTALEINFGSDTGLFRLPMIGHIFALNGTCALAAISFLTALTYKELSLKLQNSSEIKPVPGRLEPIFLTDRPFRGTVYVDYAHTPDALEKALQELKTFSSEIITVFGCGGDRDQSKRPLMGRIAAQYSKQIILTNDNPRGENPEDILNQIASGIPPGSFVSKVTDRSQAIELAIQTARFRDCILIAGKGHENYQMTGSQRSFFSDQETARHFLKRPINWLVLGAGVSGISAANRLISWGQAVSLYDDRLTTRPHELSSEVSFLPQNSSVDLDLFKKIALSPGVPLSHPLVKKAQEKNLECFTEIDLGFMGFGGQILAVTGTNGKSTTVSMVHHLLEKQSIQSFLCGNIGVPPTSENLQRHDTKKIAVVELSSYQLEGSLFHPSVGAAITSFSNDHQSRHGTLSEYFKAKWKVVRWINNESIFIVTEDVALFALSLGVIWPSCETWVLASKKQNLANQLPSHVQVVLLDQSAAEFLGQKLDLSFISGHHNQINALTAVLLTKNILKNWNPAALLNQLESFKPLAFRCEIIFQDRLRFIVNDSKSTNVESTLAALTMAKRPVILLMGGQGKGEPYAPILEQKSFVQTLITFGASGPEIMSQVENHIPTEKFGKMSEAVERALKLSKDQSLDVIFSPGCASFDEFKNFEHRGRVFNELVSSMIKN